MQKSIRWQQILIVCIASLFFAPLLACSAPVVEKKLPAAKVSKQKNIVQKSIDPQKPAWPENSIAQREFYGSQMFVEQTKAGKRAWVISEYTRWPEWNKTDGKKQKGKVLDFFSGKTEVVYLGYTDDGHSLSEFKTLKGQTHYEFFSEKNPIGFDSSWGGSPYQFKSDVMEYLPHLDFSSGDGVESPFNNAANCALQIGSINRINTYEQRKTPQWRKVILYHEPPSRYCPSGSWESLVLTALNLEDGTFLAATRRYVFRLRFSDLSPVGSAPALYVFDVETIEKALEKALVGIDPKTIADQQGFLTKALQLVPSEAPHIIKETK